MDYGQFLEGLEPVIVGLDRSTFSLDRGLYWSAPKDATRVLASKYELRTATDDYFDVIASYRVAIEWQDDTSLKVAVEIECVFSGHFHVTSPLNWDHAKTFAEDESWLVFWPYFRQFVSDTTARMSIPPIVVPMALGPGHYSRPLGTPGARAQAKRLKAKRK